MFALEGFDSVSVRRIAEACKCSAPLVIKLFGTKESIYEALFSEWTEMVLEPVITSVPDGDPISALEHVFDLITAGSASNNSHRENLSLAIYTRLSCRERIYKVLLKQQDIENDIILPLLERARQVGLIRNDDLSLLARIIWNAILGEQVIEQAFPLTQKMTFNDIRKYILGNERE